MCQLSMEELPEAERADVAQARAMLNPYLQITTVDWLTAKEPSHAPDVLDFSHRA